MSKKELNGFVENIKNSLQRPARVPLDIDMGGVPIWNPPLDELRREFTSDGSTMTANEYYRRMIEITEAEAKPHDNP